MASRFLLRVDFEIPFNFNELQAQSFRGTLFALGIKKSLFKVSA